MTIYQQYLGKLTIGSSNDDFSINDGGGAEACTLTSGEYFPAGYTSEGTDQLCEHITAVIQALGGNYAGMTLTYSASTGLATLDCDGTTTSVTWTDTALRDLLGFTGNLSGSTSYTATNQMRYVWRPSRPLTRHPVKQSRFLAERSNTRVFSSNDGTARSLKGFDTYGGDFGYDLLEDSEVVIDSSTVYEAFEQWWLDVPHEGMPFRAYPDRTLNTSTDFIECRMMRSGSDEVELGKFEDYARRDEDNYDGLWSVDFRLVKNP